MNPAVEPTEVCPSDIAADTIKKGGTEVPPSNDSMF
jgi:hypothetical protein